MLDKQFDYQEPLQNISIAWTQTLESPLRFFPWFYLNKLVFCEQLYYVCSRLGPVGNCLRQVSF